MLLHSQKTRNLTCLKIKLNYACNSNIFHPRNKILIKSRGSGQSPRTFQNSKNNQEITNNFYQTKIATKVLSHNQYYLQKFVKSKIMWTS